LLSVWIPVVLFQFLTRLEDSHERRGSLFKYWNLFIYFISCPDPVTVSLMSNNSTRTMDQIKLGKVSVINLTLKLWLITLRPFCFQIWCPINSSWATSGFFLTFYLYITHYVLHFVVEMSKNTYTLSSYTVAPNTWQTLQIICSSKNKDWNFNVKEYDLYYWHSKLYRSLMYVLGCVSRLQNCSKTSNNTT